MTRATLGGHVPAVPFDDPRHRGEADARSLVFVGVVEPRERLKQLARELRIEAGAVVGYEELWMGRRLAHTDLDAGVGCPTRELPSVAEEVVERDAEEVGIAVDDHVGSDRDHDAALGMASAQLLDDRRRGVTEIHGSTVEGASRESR